MKDQKVRKVVTRSGRGFRGKFPSKKLNRMVEFESLHECNAIKMFEGSAIILSYQEQPVLIHYYDINHIPRKYYPDFSLRLKDGVKAHVEVKPSNILATNIMKRKYKSIKGYYQNRPEHFILITEVQSQLTAIAFDEWLLRTIVEGGSNETD